MPITVYFAAGAKLWPDYERPLRRAFGDAALDIELLTERPADPAQVDYIIFAPGGDIADFAPFTRAKAVLNLWAGVEKIVALPG
ncbi:glyoxylate/hydroxypyruvate reductase A, partial [Thioclava sp. BHET1]